jgi:hypothetical protein
MMKDERKMEDQTRCSDIHPRAFILHPSYCAVPARKISRAIMIRCISEVPSPIVQSFESRQYFSAG